MKVTINWLRRYVDISWTPEELRERLTMLGVEVESMRKLGGEFEGVVVAQVLTADKHPNADKLSVCRVNDGKTERQIVCGAKNFKPGDKVPLALPGCTMPTPPGTPPFTIKVGKLRGVESQGMMCSAQELGLSEDASGLLILPTDAIVGQSLAQHLGRVSGDVVYDLEITPNRPDLNSVIGIARELSALSGNPLKLPAVPERFEPAEAPSIATVAGQVAVRLEDPELCPRYTARMVRGVKVGPSPDWLKQDLEKVGIRSISNVVDVTNYVMLEIGQPLHAFDYHLLAVAPEAKTPVIVVRRAQEGEKFTTLDGKERSLTHDMLVIADETKPVALAGVMGGLNSEIKDTTQDVLIESACFKPQTIRLASKKLELRSDASYRYERGSDIDICDWASRRAAQLILETAGGQVASGVVDAYPKRHEPKQITLRYARTNQLLGLEIAPAQQREYLNRLELPLDGTPGESSFSVRIPAFRVDLKGEIDLVEEIARLYGVDRIPSRVPCAQPGTNPFDAVYDQIAEARRLLTGSGLMEIQGQTLLPQTAVAHLPSQLVPLQNPLSGDMNVLRPSLLPGLLEVLQRNVNQKQTDLALFEMGRVFTATGNAPREERRLGIALTGQRNPLFWSGGERDAKFDIHDLKGLLEEFFAHFGLRGLTFVRRPEPAGLYLESANISLGKQSLGEIGLANPMLAKKLDLRDSVVLAELNLDLLLARRNPAKSFKPLPQYPAIRRDVAMLVEETVTHEAVLNAVKQAKPSHLETVELFDVFRGKNIPSGQKSLAYAFTYRSLDKTLTDAEASAAHEKVVRQFKEQLKAVLREG
jgi:phenylalanyl-tRNA synthetase beta chain